MRNAAVALAVPAVLVLVSLSGCIFCPDCGCYPAEWSGRWTQPEMADWAAEHAGDGRFDVREDVPEAGLPFEANAAGFPEGTALRGVTWLFGEVEGNKRTVSLEIGRDGQRLSYTYPGSHRDESDGPKRSVLAAAIDDFLAGAYAGDDAEAIKAELLATWRSVDHYEWTSGRVPVEGPWRLDEFWDEHAWDWSGPVGFPVADDRPWSLGFHVAAWTFDADGWETPVQIDDVGRVEAGSVPGRQVDVDALQDAIARQFANETMPAPTFDRFEPVPHEICVD